MTSFQQSSQATNFISQPKNNTVILSWNNPVNTGALTPYQCNLSYIYDNGVLIQSNIAYLSSGVYSQSINGLTNKVSNNFTLYTITGGTNGVSPLNGQSVTLTASASGSPIVQSISFSNKILSASVDGNGSIYSQILLLFHLMLIMFLPLVNIRYLLLMDQVFII